MRKYRIFLIAVCLLLGVNAYSQDWTQYRVGELYPGYVIKTDGTKIDGYIQAQPRGETTGVYMNEGNQARVIFYTDPKNKKQKLHTNLMI